MVEHLAASGRATPVCPPDGPDRGPGYAPGGASPTPEEHAVIASDVFTDRATGRLDSGGYMHLGFHDQAPGTSDPVVRYLAIGP
jgi:hypothetical protein